MWSRRQVLNGVLIAGLAASVAACGFRPVYQGGPTAGVAADLSAIAIDDPSSRIAQAVRNELVFLFTRGEAPAAPRYRMQLGVAERVSNLVIEGVTGRPTASSLTLTVSVVLTEIATGETVLRQSFNSSASFDQSTQRFANERARLDAGQRAARVVAERIRIRTATALQGIGTKQP